ncbi:glycosyltransferase family 4 protein [Chitinophaga ginsengisoli]|uniref:Glycosyltransferase involved in cell wall biosynthesis n=1 Tax=Chitinophaga ginsengisoli TaxID=363837 RepID=A0A2P8FUJ5_9BACT|nr:glycosyltransferase family 4 protein [Chitinophaga ginsengisoli]PSL25393.1 glycosyltransferase involved in cell wall biosynthesis [Chitinophaga ginsengisoli]
MAKASKRIAIISSCQEDWGGSEELWGRAIPHFQSAGYSIVVLKRNLNKQHEQFVHLSRQGVLLKELLPAAWILNATKKHATLSRVINMFSRLVQKCFTRVINRLRRDHILHHDDNSYWVKKKLQKIQPQFVIVSQGMNFDGLEMAYGCLQLEIPYALIAQKAVDFYWPAHINRAGLRKVYQHASCSYFVSNHNKRLTEEQFGTRFPKSEVIYNTVKVARQLIPMPGTEQGFRLACIGRYFLLDKGQDILIRIMAMPKWKTRPITISFIGAGNDKEALMAMVALLGLKNVQFLDYVEDITRLWQHHHALILPSRSEGLPLVLLEAMACGRTAIVSMAGGNPEVITDGVTGFIGHANEDDFDRAMERAWEARNEWDTVGKRAYAFIEEHVPLQPEKHFADSLLSRIENEPVKINA